MRSNIVKVFLAGTFIFSVLSLHAQQKNENSINPNDTSWYPSYYGANDEIGAANLITPELVLQSLKLVKKGKTLPLAVKIDKPARLQAP